MAHYISGPGLRVTTTVRSTPLTLAFKQEKTPSHFGCKSRTESHNDHSVPSFNIGPARLHTLHRCYTFPLRYPLPPTPPKPDLSDRWGTLSIPAIRAVSSRAWSERAYSVWLSPNSRSVCRMQMFRSSGDILFCISALVIFVLDVSALPVEDEQKPDPVISLMAQTAETDHSPNQGIA